MHRVHKSVVVTGTYEAELEWQIFPQITLKFTVWLCSKVGCEFFQGVIYYFPSCAMGKISGVQKGRLVPW